MAEKSTEKKFGWLLTTAKIVGALATIIGALAVGGAWVFSAVMAERDNQVQGLQEDIATLNQSITRLSAQLSESEGRFTNMRIAMELLNARLELRTVAAPGAAPAPVRVRVRSHPPTVSPTSVGSPVARITEPTLPLLRRPPPLEDRVFRTDHEAEVAFDRALSDLGGER